MLWTLAFVGTANYPTVGHLADDWYSGVNVVLADLQGHELTVASAKRPTHPHHPRRRDRRMRSTTAMRRHVTMHARSASRRHVASPAQPTTQHHAPTPAAPPVVTRRAPVVSPHVDNPLAPHAATSAKPAASVSATTRASVVQLVATGCSGTPAAYGSGWVIATDTVATAAHEVTGYTSVTVVTASGKHLHGRLIARDANDDFAVLSVPGLGLQPLASAQVPVPDEPAAVAGYPLGGLFDAEYGTYSSTGLVITPGIFGNPNRVLVSYEALTRPGNSGGPLLDAKGQVIGTIVAASSGGASGYAVPQATGAEVLRHATGATVNAGSCAEVG